MIKKIIYLCVLALFITPSLAHADIAIPGKKTVDYCFKIDNIQDYPNYKFIVYFQEPVGGHTLIEQDECLSFYKFSQPTIYAIQQNDFNDSSIPTNQIQEKTYFTTNKKLIPSGITMQSAGSIDDKDPLENMVDVLHIITLNKNSFQVQKLKAIYTYEDGTSEEKIYTNQNIQPEPKTASWMSKYWWYVVVPVIAFLGIAFILIRRKTKQK